MQYRNVSVMGCWESPLSAYVLFDDGKGEYNLQLVCTIFNDKVKIESYAIMKGATIGF